MQGMKANLSAPAKLAGFAGALVVVLAAGFGAARAVSPEGLAHRSSATEHAGHDSMAGMPGMASSESTAGVPGLAVAQAGYRLVPQATTLASGPAQPFSFQLLGPDGRPVERYDRLHDRELHLIVVRRDLTGYQHVHPTRDAGGTWSVPLDLPTAGTWRALADFQPAGGPGQLTLGTDLQVGGTFEVGTTPSAVAPPDPRLDVRFDRQGDEIAVTVRRDGDPVQPEPYLGARGHLVALRAGDLAYLHVHPLVGPGPEVRFQTALPTAGTYALFFDYQVDGVVHTGVTTVEVSGGQGQ